ncbi:MULTISPECIES: hypothetical protein, partial [unclassified Bradyrhizobium]
TRQFVLETDGVHDETTADFFNGIGQKRPRFGYQSGRESTRAIRFRSGGLRCANPPYVLLVDLSASE